MLHRLEKEGVISSKWRVTESGRKQKYYQINEQGKIALQQEKHQWKIVNETLSKLWEGSDA